MYSKLRGVRLIGCKFNRTNLLEVEWRTTDFTDVKLSGAINFYSGLLENVLLCNTTMPDGNVITEETYWEA
ncbi:pentapeptide repeat-containing protein [uncultured Nostoc sp.]|uniref:pentapeptide repeat-containing protein n=1 Tax=uncultured Nostoc sp. TaxID=340711 RepID=UPI0026281648|nr:pentapeptide repeat-containing protein [uncultured Nostoc sp.]